MTPECFAPAYSGDGYGTMRRNLFESARMHIEGAIEQGYYCEAIAICESVISDRLESRLSFLKKEPVAFGTLARLCKEIKKHEEEGGIRDILPKVNLWRESRNRALHEMVKVYAQQTDQTWALRMKAIRQVAHDGYRLACRIYWRVAELNPNHPDRVFPEPENVERWLLTID